MFLILLQDLDYFNLYVKKTVRKFIFIKESSPKKDIDRFESIEVDHKEAEETKHIFLYINEAQKTSDRLYEFYYNRYYYKKARSLVTFPTFLNIESKDYNRVKSATKKIDRNLVSLVKNSKYESR